MEIWLRYHETEGHVKGGAQPYSKFINIVLRNKLHDSSLHSHQWHYSIQSQNGEVSLENAALKPKKRELRSSIYVTCNAKTTVDGNLRDTWKSQQQQLSCCFDNVRRRGWTGRPEFSGCRKYVFLRTQYVSHVRESCSEVIIFISIRLTCECSVVSDLLQPYGLQPTRLLCPWDFSGKYIGVAQPFPPPRDLPHPGIEPKSLASPALTGRFFTTVPPGKLIRLIDLIQRSKQYLQAEKSVSNQPEQGCVCSHQAGFFQEIPSKGVLWRTNVSTNKKKIQL